MAEKKRIELKDYEPPHYWIRQVSLHFDLHEDHSLVTAVSQFERNPKFEAETPLILDGRDMELVSVKLDGQALNPSAYSLSPTQLVLPSVPERGELEVVTRIKPQENTALEGLYKSGNIFCTQCEAHGFQRITYFVDRPDNMAVYTTRITADQSLYPVLLSNGNLIDSGSLPEGRHFATWEDPFKKPSYLFALVAGRLDVLEDEFVTCSGRKVALKIYTDPGRTHRVKFAMESLKKSMGWDEERFGREYDLDIFMVVAVDAFNMGAMENKGLNIFNSMAILADSDTATDARFEHIESIVGHEYFHNWTGNRITCRDWFQLSLKEGLTVYRDQEFTADMRSRAVKRIDDVDSLRNSQFKEDAGPNAHPVRPESCYSVDNFYTATVYDKGAEVIRMMATLLGEKGFRKGMDLYFQLYDGQAVTTEHFVQAMEQANNVDLSQFRLWYSQAGTPQVEVKSHYSPENNSFTLKFRQSLPKVAGQEKPLPMVIPLRLGLLDSQGLEITLRLQPQLQEVGSLSQESQSQLFSSGNSDSASRLNRLMHQDLLVLTQAEESFCFTQVPERPTASLLRHFSAPVQLHYEISDEERLHLMKKDSDPFNRWEAGQKLLLKTLLQLERDLSQGGAPRPVAPALIEGFSHCLQQGMEDPLFSSRLLDLPTYDYAAQFCSPLRPDFLFLALHSLRSQLGWQLKEQWQSLYGELADSLTQPAKGHDSRAQGLRALKNRALHYWLAATDPAAHGLGHRANGASRKAAPGGQSAFPSPPAEALKAAESQYFSAQNMTDRVAALEGLKDHPCPERDHCFADFYQRWGQDSVVVNTWFKLEAASHRPQALEKLEELSRLPVFSFTNPNNVRNLIGGFTHGNILAFHAQDGSGYGYLADQVIFLDQKNPQLAARLVQGLEDWKKLEPHRSELMRTQLERITIQPNLSPNSFELASKALDGGP